MIIRDGTGKSKGWAPQRRSVEGYSWAEVARFHWLETWVGFAMVTGFAIGTLSFWLAPIAFSLVLAIPLSKLSAVRIADWRLAPARLDSPQNLREPRIVSAARLERAAMKELLARDPLPNAIAAE